MRPLHFLCSLLLIASPPAGAQREDAALLAHLESGFEPGGSLPAKDFVAEASMSGPLHKVRPLAYNDGLRNTYFIDVSEGVLEITGTPELMERIREVYALDYLRGLSKTEEFTKALAASGKAKVESAVDMVRDPIGTIKNVPKGASRLFGRIGEGLKGGKSEGEGGSLAGLSGVTKAKAKIAAELKISPYTTNEPLQQELTRVARASAGGGLILNLAASAATGGAGAALSIVGVNQSLHNVLISSSPEDLRLLNRKKLLALGADPSLTETFLMHPWFSPWHETITTDALAQIGVDPSSFLTAAVRALTADDAFFFQRAAQILAKYHATTTPLRAILLNEDIVTALDRNGTLVVPVSLDYAIWAEYAARRIDQFVALDRSHEEIKALALWTDGRLSERLCEELKKRSIAYRMQALGNP